MFYLARQGKTVPLNYHCQLSLMPSEIKCAQQSTLTNAVNETLSELFACI